MHGSTRWLRGALLALWLTVPASAQEGANTIDEGELGRVRWDAPVFIQGALDEPRGVATADLGPGGDDETPDLVVAGADGIWVLHNEKRENLVGLNPANLVHATTEAASGPLGVFDLDADGATDLVYAAPAPAWLVGDPAFATGGSPFDPGAGAPGFSPVATDIAVSRSGGVVAAVAGDLELGRVGAAGELTLETTLRLPGTGTRLTALSIDGQPFFAVGGMFEFGEATRPGVLLAGPTDLAAPLQYEVASAIALETAVQEEVVALAAADWGGGRPTLIVVTQGDATGNGAFDSGTVRTFVIDETLALSETVYPDPTPPWRTSGPPKAVAVADFLPVAPAGPDGIPDVVVVGDVRLQANRPAPFIDLFEAGVSGRIEYASPFVDSDTSFSRPIRITDLAVGDFNSDETLDVVLANSDGDDLLLYRQQPPPCATFVTAFNHGHRGGTAIAYPLNTTPLEINFQEAYNANLRRRIRDADRLRRPVWGELTNDPDELDDLEEFCPVAHVGVNGHWEGLTVPGAKLTVFGRVFWLSSGYLVPAPVCLELLPFALPIIHPDPFSFWLSGVFLNIPVFFAVTTPNPGCVPVLPNFASVAQFTVAGLGAGVELLGVMLSAASSRIAAGQLAGTLEDAISGARNAMDRCEGELFLDVAGHSRGDAVISQAMLLLDDRDLAYNARVAIQHLDPIDPSWGSVMPNFPSNCLHGDSCRPWAKAGFLVQDPLVLRNGNERISVMGATFPTQVAGMFGFLTPVFDGAQAFVNGLPGLGLNVGRDVIGFPVGYNRSSDLGPGRFETAAGLQHTQVRFNMLGGGSNPPSPLSLPTGFPPTPAPGFSTPFTYANVSEIGFMLDADANDPSKVRVEIDSGPGWRKNGAPSSESDRLPAECPGASGASQSAGASLAGLGTTYTSSAQARQFVHDHDFSLSEGFVRLVRQLLGFGRLDKRLGVGQLFPAPEQREIRNLVRRTAARGFPSEDMVWTEVDPPATCVKGGTGPCARLEAVTPVDFHEQVSSRILDELLAGAPEPSDAASIEARTAAWRQTLKAQADDPVAFGDTINLFSRVLSGGSRTDEAYVAFPKKPATLAQVLHNASASRRELFLRAVFEFTSPDGELMIRLLGNGLGHEERVAASDVGQGVRRDLDALVSRRRRAQAREPDAIQVTGRNVRVYSVSVTADAPIVSRTNGRTYELMLVEAGTDWQAARVAAERSLYRGRPGRLASFDARSTDAYTEVFERLRPDAYTWLGASGAGTGPDDFRWIEPEMRFEDSPWLERTRFRDKPKGLAYVFAHPAHNGKGRFGFSGPAVTREGLPFGYLIDYGRTGKASPRK